MLSTAGWTGSCFCSSAFWSNSSAAADEKFGSVQFLMSYFDGTAPRSLTAIMLMD